MELGEYRV